VALLGLLVLGVDFLNGLAFASVLTVLCTMATATTLLPALLRVIGKRALSRRERRRLAGEGAHEEHAEGFWLRWARAVHRRPAIFAGVAVLVMVVLAAPFLSLRLGSSDQGNDPKSTTTRQAYDMLATGFGPGFNGPLQVVAQLPADPAARQADHRVLDDLRTTLRGMHGVASAAPPIYSPDGSVGIIQVVPTTSPQDKQTSALIKQLRHHTIPDATRGSGMTTHVGGVTAIFDDFAGVLRGKLPLFIAVIVALGCLLLLVAFRSLMIPAMAAVMNLIAAAASFGLVTVLFQWGWGGDALGLGKPGPVEAFLPVMMMAILFGLSMDYQVFLVSRMHEEWSHHRDNTRAVTLGQASTGRVITAAATIMIFVFGAFVLDGRRVVEEFGIGLAGAVLLDAFILRTALVPALMHMMGRRNWYLPRWLDRVLPHLSVDPADEPAPAVAQPDREKSRPVVVTGGRR
jgi:putative drug exporter of the RND superfamily